MAVNGARVASSVKDVAKEIKDLSRDARERVLTDPSLMAVAAPMFKVEDDLTATEVVTALDALQHAVDVPADKRAEFDEAVRTWMTWAEQHRKFLETLQESAPTEIVGHEIQHARSKSSATSPPDLQPA